MWLFLFGVFSTLGYIAYFLAKAFLNGYGEAKGQHAAGEYASGNVVRRDSGWIISHYCHEYDPRTNKVKRHSTYIAKTTGKPLDIRIGNPDGFFLETINRLSPTQRALPHDDIDFFDDCDEDDFFE